MVDKTKYKVDKTELKCNSATLVKYSCWLCTRTLLNGARTCTVEFCKTAGEVFRVIEAYAIGNFRDVSST